MAGNVWSGNLGEGYLSSHNLSKKLRMTVKPLMRFEQFADVEDATQQGLHKGDTFHYDVFTKVKTAGSATGISAHTAYGYPDPPGGGSSPSSTLGNSVDVKHAQTGNNVPETDFETVQGSITIKEYANSIPFSSKLDDLSEVPVTKIINKVLKDDAAETLDTACFLQFNDAPLTLVDTGSGYSYLKNGSVTAVNNAALDKSHIIYIIDTMRERNIPGFGGNNNYYAIAHPTTYTTLKASLESIHQYTTEGLGMIKNGEMGKYRDMIFIEQTQVAKDYDSESTFTTNSKSNWAFFFGEDTVAEAIAIPLEMRGRIPDDYGRKRGIAWYALLGYGLVHTYDMRPTGTSDNPNARILKWGSTTS